MIGKTRRKGEIRRDPSKLGLSLLDREGCRIWCTSAFWIESGLDCFISNLLEKTPPGIVVHLIAHIFVTVINMCKTITTVQLIQAVIGEIKKKNKLSHNLILYKLISFILVV